MGDRSCTSTLEEMPGSGIQSSLVYQSCLSRCNTSTSTPVNVMSLANHSFPPTAEINKPNYTE